MVMLIGILSDSHGRDDTTRLAVARLIDAGAQSLVHLGDIGSVQVIDALIGHNARIVFGNCDWDAAGLAEYARHVGVVVDDPMGCLEITGKSIAYTHGHRGDLVQQAIAQGVDYLLHGHTHEIRNERFGRTRVINPGALFRAARYTAALLDPAADHVQFIDVPRPT